MKDYKFFVLVYCVFTLLLLVFGVDTVIAFPDFELLDDFSLGSIIAFTASIGKFILDLLFYTFEDATIINVLLWGFRILAFIDVLPYLKKLVHPTQA